MYVIDGHNLIPKIAGWSLAALDDEALLLSALQTFTRRTRQPVEVFFDGAPPGQAGTRMVGSIRAHFVPLGTTADEAIRRYVAAQRQRQTLIVVSSDRQVRANARALGAQSQSSEEFAARFSEVLNAPESPTPEKPVGAGSGPSAARLGEWYDLFAIDAAQAEQPIEIQPDRKPPKPAEKKSAGKKRAHHGFEKKG